jgi:hypothetical protein
MREMSENQLPHDWFWIESTRVGKTSLTQSHLLSNPVAAALQIWIARYIWPNSKKWNPVAKFLKYALVNCAIEAESNRQQQPVSSSQYTTHHTNVSCPFPTVPSKHISRNQPIKLDIRARKMQLQLPSDPPTSYLNLWGLTHYPELYTFLTYGCDHVYGNERSKETHGETLKSAGDAGNEGARAEATCNPVEEDVPPIAAVRQRQPGRPCR